VSSGLPLALLFHAVHDSNLTKTPLVQTGHGRGVKGPDYAPPDVAGALTADAARRQPSNDFAGER